MKKITLLLSFAIVFAFSLNSTKLYGQPSVDLVASVDVTPPLTNGQLINYSIMSTGSPYNALRIKLVYDPVIIQLNSLTPVYAFDFTPVNDTSTPGLVKYEAAELGGNVGTDEIIFNIEFQVLDNTQNIMIAHNYDAADGTVVTNNSGTDILGTANDINLNTLSVDEIGFGNSILVFPNPVKDDLNIKINNSSSNLESINFNTIDGKLIKSIKNFEINNNLILVNTSQFTSGLYFMTLYSEKGEKMTYKVIVED